MIKISVVIPVYNVALYLRECLDSVVNQSFKDIEIICINDGSTDSSLEILNEYAEKDNRIKIINKKNAGVAQARNTGIENASGEYILFLDPDDYICEDILEKMYKFAKKENTDFLMSRSIAFTKEYENEYCTAFVKNINEGFLNIQSVEICKITKDKFIRILENYPCVVWGNLYKRDFIINNGLEFIKQNIIHEDDGFFVKVLSCKPLFSAIDDICVMYRIRSNSAMGGTSKNKRLRKKSMVCVLKDSLDFIKNTMSEDYNFYKNKILNESLYSNFFGPDIAIPFVFQFIWHKKNKRVKIFFVPIYRDKISENRRVIKVFGIPVFIKKLKEGVI